MLVTSRMPLAPQAERAHRVPQLAVPDLRRPAVAEEVMDYESVRLFVDRARAAAVDFSVTDVNAEAVAEICRQARRAAAGDRACRAAGADAHAAGAAAPARPAAAAADGRRAGRRRAPADAQGDDRVELRPAARRRRRRCSRGSRSSSAAAGWRRPRRCATSTAPSAPGCSTGSTRSSRRASCASARTPTASRASGCSRRSGSSALELLESAGELEARVRAARRLDLQTRPSGSTPSRGPATTRPFSRASTTSTRTCARRSRWRARDGRR